MGQYANHGIYSGGGRRKAETGAHELRSQVTGSIATSGLERSAKSINSAGRQSWKAEVVRLIEGMRLIFYYSELSVEFHFYHTNELEGECASHALAVI